MGASGGRSGGGESGGSGISGGGGGGLGADECIDADNAGVDADGDFVNAIANAASDVKVNATNAAAMALPSRGCLCCCKPALAIPAGVSVSRLNLRRRRLTSLCSFTAAAF